MKYPKILLASVFSFVFSFAKSQDSSHAWHWTLGLDIGTVPTYHISGTDTTTVNALALSPSISFGHKSGFAISYSPAIVAGGMTPGVYLHKFGFGYSQYDKDAFDIAIDYNHYFFTGNSAVPYSPISNELSLDYTYKKLWLRPGFSAGLGFGTDNSGKTAASVADFGASFGLSHAFDWDKDKNSFSLTPSVSINGGTNQYFSFLGITRYIGKSKQFTNYISKGLGASRGKNKKTGSAFTSTSTSTSTTNFELSNIELHLSSSYEHDRFTMRPEASLYFPIGSAAGSGISGYWGIALQYKL